MVDIPASDAAEAGGKNLADAPGLSDGRAIPDVEPDDIAKLAQALSTVVHSSEVLDVVADAMGPLLDAHSVNISLLDETEQMMRLVVSRRSSPQVRLHFATYAADLPYPTRDAVITRRTVTIQGLQERDRRYPALAGVAVSQVAWAVLPLVADDRTLGTLSLGWTAPQPFDVDQLQVCERVADLAAAVLARAQRFDSEEHARTAAEDLARRLGILQDLTTQLSEATDVAAVGDFVVGAGLQALDADAAAIGLLNDGTTFTALASVGIPEELLPRWSTHDVSQSAQVIDLRTSLRPVVATSRAERDERFPDPNRQDDFEATATLPLVTGGTLLGVVAYAWKHARIFDKYDVDYLTAIAAHAATAIDRSRLIDRTRQVAEILQRALLPEAVTDLPGWELATCYIPAIQDTQVGGDWYDAFPTADGRLVVALGDVAGKGIRAAAVMGALRSALRAYATIDPTPSMILYRLDTYCAAFKDQEMATLVVAVLDPPTGALTYACAGHLPPLLTDEKTTQWLDEATSPPLGANDGSSRTQTATRIRPGQALLLYSDGLVERRDQDLAESLAILADQARTLTQDGQDLRAAATALVKKMDAPAKFVDDTALLVLRRDRGAEVNAQTRGTDPV